MANTYMLDVPRMADGNQTIASWPTCDRGEAASSLYRVVTPSGPLYLCGHHFRENGQLFFTLGYRWLGPHGYDPRTCAEMDYALDELDDDDD